jgi:FAD/FMN-containing dehydrogenase
MNLTEGLTSVQNGILISFSKMQSVTYSPATDTITLQPGMRWVDAIAAVETYGVAPLGGRVGLAVVSSES